MSPAPNAAAAIAAELEREARGILAWWAAKTVDDKHGGFLGEIDDKDRPTPGAPKGAVLNARILWFMSEAARALGDGRARALADRAADYFLARFVDPVHGGVFWALDAEGAPLARKKQTYAQAFAIYALCAHHRATGRHDSLAEARRLFALLEARAKEPEFGGYIEARGEDWAPLADMRLSEADANAPKSMNTHLHLLEALTALYATAPTPQIRTSLRGCVELFLRHIVDRGRSHLRLFFDNEWTPTTRAVSFGHDIEASWLLWEACESLGDVALSERAKPVALLLARGCLEEGVWSDGGVINERAAAGHADTSRIWWVQAEALVGFLSAYELSGEGAYFDAFAQVWAFVKAHQKDAQHGEWTWRSSLDPPTAHRPYKAGFWKGPYHNGRAMIEARARLAALAARK